MQLNGRPECMLQFSCTMPWLVLCSAGCREIPASLADLCVGLQMAKLGVAMTQARTGQAPEEERTPVAPENGNTGSSPASRAVEGTWVRPQGFKTLVGRNHPEFSSPRQQVGRGFNHCLHLWRLLLLNAVDPDLKYGGAAACFNAVIIQPLSL